MPAPSAGTNLSSKRTGQPAAKLLCEVPLCHQPSPDRQRVTHGVTNAMQNPLSHLKSRKFLKTHSDFQTQHFTEDQILTTVLFESFTPYLRHFTALRGDSIQAEQLLYDSDQPAKVPHYSLVRQKEFLKAHPSLRLHEAGMLSAVVHHQRPVWQANS